MPLFIPPIDENTQKILAFCTVPKSALENTDMLGYKDKKIVRRYLNSYDCIKIISGGGYEL